MARSGLLWALLLMVAPTAGVQADIYRWKDAAGVTHFTNAVPPDGATLIEVTEETPYDAEADRRRLEEERRLRLEREKLALEERKAALAAREHEAQLKLDEASRRLEEAEQQTRESAAEGEPDDGVSAARHLWPGPQKLLFQSTRGREPLPGLLSRRRQPLHRGPPQAEARTAPIAPEASRPAGQVEGPSTQEESEGAQAAARRR